MKRESKRNIRRAREGFTLIEVLLVVVIIGILAAVAVPRLGGRVGQAKESKAKSDIKSIGLALRMYEVDNGNYPSSLQGLLVKSGNSDNWRGPYLESGLPDDPWGTPYTYQYPGSKNSHSYDLSSMGADGVSSGDDISNWTQ